jgi:hypothetical protein
MIIMTKTRIIGDVHGLKYELSLLLDNLPEDVTEAIQVGDLGVGFGQGDHWHESLDEMFSNVNGGFIRGNHDSPEQCKQMSTWIPDGTVKDNMFSIGGAWSIDQQYRVPGKSWWPEEELSYSQLELMISTYDMIRPDIMITHDVAKSAAEYMFFTEGRPLYGKHKYRTRTAQALDTMWEIHKPKVWCFGHWHFDIDQTIHGTRFICLNELSYCDLNRETLEVTFPNYWKPINRDY